MIRIAIDIGGAFTDLVAYDDETLETTWVKGESTPKNPSKGVLDVLEKCGIDLSRAQSLIHGQTLVINLVIERKGAKIGLITTPGYRDNLELQRGNRRDMFNFRYKKPEPFVPRHLRKEVEERIMGDGSVIKSLNKDQLKEVAEGLLKEGVNSLCISFLNSYANPENEIKAKALLSELFPEMPITIGSEITREWGEYERTSTAVLNAFVKPQMRQYLGTLEKETQKKGFKGSLYAVLSSGGMSPFSFVMDFPIYSVESGPVAGVLGAVVLSNILGLKDIIALDGGSTTTKASLVEGLEPRIHSDYYIERDRFNTGYPVKVPVVDTQEVGNGGTSIAWIDAVGNLKVGPRAMGADPGPACYGKGGEEPTVTDAYVINGLINPEYLLGGQMKIYRDLAVKAMNRIAERYNMSLEEAAEGVIKIANENAANAVRVVSVQRGYDPRDFTLIAYGGSGPMFAPFMAEELEIKRIVVPCVQPGVFSAWGMLLLDVKHDAIVTEVTPLEEKEMGKIKKIFSEVEEKVLKEFEEEDIKGIELMRFADMRYQGQEHTVKVPIRLKSSASEILKDFGGYHEREYSYKLDAPVEIVNFHVSGISKTKKIELKEKKSTAKSIRDAVKGEREVFLKGSKQKLPVIAKELMPINAKGRGPAIIEDPTSTIIVLKSQSFMSDKFGNIVITKEV